MDDITGFITDAAKLVESHAWLPLASLAIFLAVRLLKDDRFVAWFPVTIEPRYRSLAAMVLGIISGVLQGIVGGAKWPTALAGGIVSAVTAISGHELVVESLRKGRDIGVPKDTGGSGGPPMGSKSGRPGAPYSTRMVGLVFLLAIACLTGFDCTKTNGKPVLTWPDVVQCAGDPLEIVGDVADVLINDYGGKELSVVGKQKLEKLALEKGTPAVLCIVDRLVREWVAPAAAPDPSRIAAAARGDSFLRTIGTKVQRN